MLVLRPSVRNFQEDSDGAMRRMGEQFRHLVNTAIAVLLVTGVILTVSRLTSNYVGIPYIVVLTIKVTLALYMFYLVRFLRPRTYAAEATTHMRGFHRITSLFTGATAVLVLGVIVFLLSDILRALIEEGIKD